MEIPVSGHRRAGVAHKSGIAFDSSSAAARRNIRRGCSASLQRGGKRQPAAADARVNRFRSVSLALVAAGVLVFCLASIALSITGIIGRIPGLSSSAAPTPAAVHAASGSTRTTVPAAIADEAQPDDRIVQHDPLVSQ